MRTMEMQVLTAPGCVHCHSFLKFWNTESSAWKNIVLRELDILTEEGQRLVSTYHIFALPGIIIDGALFSTGEPDIEKLRAQLAELST